MTAEITVLCGRECLVGLVGLMLMLMAMRLRG